MADITCEIPKPIQYDAVKAAYDKARKANPKLTPAAWRKAAAHELGVDYETFLKVWKTKGKTPVVPAPMATPAALKAPGPTMDLLKPKDPSPVPASTTQGTLDHATVKAAYAKAKKEIPGGTPAVWRKAAAEALGVDYKDFLAAWKNKAAKQVGTNTVKKAAAPKAPEIKPEPLLQTPKEVAKFAEVEITEEIAKDIAMELMGSKANRAFLDMTYLGKYDRWQVILPKSVVPDTAIGLIRKRAIDLGLDVEIYGRRLQFKNKIKPKRVGLDDKGRPVINEGMALTDGKKFYEGLSSAEQKALFNYTGPWYSDINRYLRTGEAMDGTMGSVDLRPKIKGMIKNMDSAFTKVDELDEAITVFRGIQAPPPDFKAGKVFKDEGYHSTAISSKFAWSKNTFIEITMPKGSKGIYVDGFSAHSGEREMLLPRGMRFLIKSVKEDPDKPGRTIVKMEVIP